MSSAGPHEYCCFVLSSESKKRKKNLFFPQSIFLVLLSDSVPLKETWTRVSICEWLAKMTPIDSAGNFLFLYSPHPQLFKETNKKTKQTKPPPTHTHKRLVWPTGTANRINRNLGNLEQHKELCRLKSTKAANYKMLQYSATVSFTFSQFFFFFKIFLNVSKTLKVINFPSFSQVKRGLGRLPP